MTIPEEFSNALKVNGQVKGVLLTNILDKPIARRFNTDRLIKLFVSIMYQCHKAFLQGKLVVNLTLKCDPDTQEKKDLGIVIQGSCLVIEKDQRNPVEEVKNIVRQFLTVFKNIKSTTSLRKNAENCLAQLLKVCEEKNATLAQIISEFENRAIFTQRSVLYRLNKSLKQVTLLKDQSLKSKFFKFNTKICQLLNSNTKQIDEQFDIKEFVMEQIIQFLQKTLDLIIMSDQDSFSDLIKKYCTSSTQQSEPMATITIAEQNKLKFRIGLNLLKKEFRIQGITNIQITIMNSDTSVYHINRMCESHTQISPQEFKQNGKKYRSFMTTIKFQEEPHTVMLDLLRKIDELFVVQAILECQPLSTLPFSDEKVFGNMIDHYAEVTTDLNSLLTEHYMKVLQGNKKEGVGFHREKIK